MSEQIEDKDTLESPKDGVATETVEGVDADELARLAKAAEDETLDDVSKEDMAKALLALNNKNKQLYTRAKKAEEQAKAKKAEDEAAKAAAEANKTNNNKEQDFNDAMDLRFLQRDGATEEDIAKLRQIQAGAKAMGKTISLIEAQQDELYQAYQDKKKAAERRDNAQLKSNGSSRSDAQEKVSKMTPEQHAAFAREKADAVRRSMGL